MTALSKEKWCGTIFRQSKRRAVKHSLDFNIELNYLYKIWEKQDGRCALTDMAFSLKDVDSSKRRPFIPSLDRIDRKKGYTKGNVRIVTVAVNMALFTWGDSVFDEVAMLRVSKLNSASKVRSVIHQPKVENIPREDKLMSRGFCESFFGLKGGWFNGREKLGLDIPPAFSKENRGGGNIWYKYKKDDVDDFLRKHPETRKFVPWKEIAAASQV